MKTEKKKILVAEDEYFLAETIKARLEFMGYEVVCVEDGVEALKVLKETRIHLVVMDYMMPLMDGIEATRQIKMDPKLRNIPIIFLSARARPEDQEKARKVGANDYLVKPFESQALISLIEKWLSS